MVAHFTRTECVYMHVHVACKCHMSIRMAISLVYMSRSPLICIYTYMPRSPPRLRFIKKKMRVSPYEIVATSSEGNPMTLAQARSLVITPGRLQRGHAHDPRAGDRPDPDPEH